MVLKNISPGCGVRASLMLFFMLAHIMSSLCGVDVHVSDFSDETTRPRDMLFFLPHSCRGIVFTHGVWMGGRAAGKSVSGLYLRNRKVDTW